MGRNQTTIARYGAASFSSGHFSGPVRLKKKSGEYCDTDMILRPISDNRGQITNVVYSCQVLSDHAEVVRVNPANLTPMLETAHHLNNVLQMLMANADLTCTALPPEHPLRSRMQDIKASAHRAGALGRLLLGCEPIKAAASACSAVAVPVHRNSERQMSASDD